MILILEGVLKQLIKDKMNIDFLRDNLPNYSENKRDIPIRTIINLIRFIEFFY